MKVAFKLFVREVGKTQILFLAGGNFDFAKFKEVLIDKKIGIKLVGML